MTTYRCLLITKRLLLRLTPHASCGVGAMHVASRLRINQPLAQRQTRALSYWEKIC